MANKPQGKSWSEIQMAITAVAITATLAFWNIFSAPDKSLAAAKMAETSTPPAPPTPTETELPTETAVSAPTASLGLRPIKIIYGGKAPVQQVVQVAAAPAKKRKSGGGGGGGDSGGGGGGSAPAASQPASTGSSKP
ncbi:MAG: hypothetical protein NTW32_03500 [Chloroflexi bacterium]|nr:hypothetical protein [Chloroflexota bacterium]